MKISLDAAMRARDVSQPTAADEIAAAETDTDGSAKSAILPRQPRRARVPGSPVRARRAASPEED